MIGTTSSPWNLYSLHPYFLQPLPLNPSLLLKVLPFWFFSSPPCFPKCQCTRQPNFVPIGLSLSPSPSEAPCTETPCYGRKSSPALGLRVGPLPSPHPPGPPLHSHTPGVVYPNTASEPWVLPVLCPQMSFPRCSPSWVSTQSHSPSSPTPCHSAPLTHPPLLLSLSWHLS